MTFMTPPEGPRGASILRPPHTQRALGEPPEPGTLNPSQSAGSLRAAGCPWRCPRGPPEAPQEGIWVPFGVPPEPPGSFEALRILAKPWQRRRRKQSSNWTPFLPRFCYAKASSMAPRTPLQTGDQSPDNKQTGVGTTMPQTVVAFELRVLPFCHAVEQFSDHLELSTVPMTPPHDPQRSLAEQERSYAVTGGVREGAALERSSLHVDCETGISTVQRIILDDSRGLGASPELSGSPLWAPEGTPRGPTRDPGRAPKPRRDALTESPGDSLLGDLPVPYGPLDAHRGLPESSGEAPKPRESSRIVLWTVEIPDLQSTSKLELSSAAPSRTLPVAAYLRSCSASLYGGS